MDMVYVRIFIGVSVRMYMSIYICTVFLRKYEQLDISSFYFLKETGLIFFSHIIYLSINSKMIKVYEAWVRVYCTTVRVGPAPVDALSNMSISLFEDPTFSKSFSTSLYNLFDDTSHK
jgi:hypothetical protein